MITIAVIEGIKEKEFNNYLSYILDLLHVEHSIIHSKNLKNNNVNYGILNSSKKELKELTLSADNCLVNMDSSLGGSLNVYGNMITYGFGNKNTVTLSSLEKDNESFVYCLQRYLSLRLNKVLEPQEIPISLKFNNDTELYAAMAAVTIALLEGSSCSDIEKRLYKKYLILS